MYQIRTQDTDRKRINRILGENFRNWTETRATGYWQGKREASLVIDLETDDRAKVLDVAEAIRRENNQQAVLVSHIQSDPTIVTFETFRGNVASNSGATNERQEGRAASNEQVLQVV